MYLVCQATVLKLSLTETLFVINIINKNANIHAVFQNRSDGADHPIL